MVLHACRAVLGDEHDARDAFQVTFLILARRGRSLWVRDSVGPWLYRVARRAALRARRNAARRRVVERQALDAAGPPRAAGEEGVAAVVHEEIDRLPERYRIPVLLCDLEGRTYEEAARHLGCPVGTVKSRLARGRARLRTGLTRRGVAPAVGALAAVPAAWARDAVRAATSPKTASGVSAAVTALTRDVLKSMFLIQLRVASGILAIGMVTLSAFVVAAGPSPGPPDGQPAPAVQTKGVTTRAGLFAPQAWRSEPYRGPDFAGFFPDDPEGASALAALWDEVKRELEHQEATPNVAGRTPWWLLSNRRSDDEILQMVRRGLRRIDGERRIWVIRWIGARYIPAKGPQNPDAIEILYHAMDYRDDRHYDNATSRYAQGPCSILVQPKTHALRRALVELGMREDNPDILSNIVTATAMAGPAGRAEMLADLARYLASGDAAVREKARALQGMFKGEIDSWEWAVEPARKRALAKYGSQLPKFREALRSGTSRERKQTMEFLGEERIDLILDDSFLDPLRACADDPGEDVRMGVFNLITESWFAGLGERPEGIALVARLLKDRSHRIRGLAVKHVLGRQIALPEPVVRALVQAVITEPEELSVEIGTDEITAGLRPSRAAVKKLLDECLRDPALKRSARSWYRTMVEADPPAEIPAGGPYAIPVESL
jgi:RNA polymerase sigma factor (sigma-70 family)